MKIPICEKCVYYVIDKRKAYCEEDMWPDTDIIKTKLYNPIMFDCLCFESREKYIKSKENTTN